MNSTLTVVLIVVLLTFFVVIGLYMHFVMNKKKWTCREGGCELDIDGEYDTKKDCLNSCANRSTVAVNEQDQTNMNYWACTKDNECVKASQGYSTREGCEQNCLYSGYYSNYYPQSLIPAIRPNYWDYRDLWRPYWRHRRHKK